MSFRDDRESERRAQALKKRFARQTERDLRRARLRRLPSRLWAAKWRLFLFAGALAAASGWVFFVSSSREWPVHETLLHALAAPGCSAARFVGLAPAPVGRPGYYLSHDADRDGVACEANRVAD